MTWQQVWARRLARQFLLNRAPYESLVHTVGAVCGIQAQVMPAAELSVGIRVEGVTRNDVQAALWQRRSLVKTYGIRGTIHLFPSDELPLWMAALRARSTLDVNKQHPLGLDALQLSSIVEAIRTALDSRQLTMQQLGEEVVRQVGSWAGETTGQAWGAGWPRWRLALGEAALDGALCYGPPQGTQVTFVRSDQWIGSVANRQDATPDEALAEVFRRYLRAYGPATPRDFAQWFNLPPRAARDLATRLQDELQEVEVESYRCYVLREEAETVGVIADFAAELPPRLLPHFDCYVIGCHPRDRLLPAIWSERVPPRTTPSQLPVLLVDGMVAGLWERETKGKRVEVRVEPFASLDKRQRTLLEEEAARLGAFLGAEAALTIGPVSIRPHL
jgi:hypothetical protein